jgi:hypothetical protein
MASATEAAQAKSQLASGLAQGVQTLSGNEQVTFTLYVKLVLPLDGYVFWVNANLLTDSAIYNASQYNRLELDKYTFSIPPKQITASGSFHLAQELHQLEDRTTTYNHIIFTSIQPIQEFNLVNPNLIYIAKYENNTFAFSRRDNFYKQADLYHYRGDALYSIMNTQVIDTMTGFDTQSPIVSNSLPIWLTLNQFFPMYPSYLVAQNLPPPYAAVEITANETEALGQFPIINNVIPSIGNPTQSTYNQLTTDTVKISMFGIRNNEALNFAEYVYQYSMNTDNIGLMNMPIIQDEKVTQPELGIIAMKKTITFKVSYYQNTVNNVALKYIQSAFCSLTPTNLV